MPLFYQQDINATTRLGLWQIVEEERFFLERVPLQRDITHPHKRLQHLAGRYLLQYLFPDFPYGEMLIADSRKPYLPQEQYHFSISHCGDFAAAIVSQDHRVGIDIEMISARVNRIRHKFLDATEWQQAQQQATDDAQRLEWLSVLWSAKEAVYKWWSFGEVQFNEQITLQPQQYARQGSMPAQFRKAGAVYPLTLYWRLFPGMSLVWLSTTEEADRSVV